MSSLYEVHRLGLQSCYNGHVNRTQYREIARIFNSSLSANYSLKLDCMKVKLQVIAEKKGAVNQFY